MTKFALLLLIFITVGLASGARYFVVEDVSPIVLTPNSQADFTIRVQNLGDEGDYARPIFRNLSEGIKIIDAPEQAYVFPGSRRTYNATIAAEDVPPGDYSLEIGVYGRGSPPNYREISFDVEPSPQAEVVPVQEPVVEPEDLEPGPLPSESEPSEGEGGRTIPGPGFILALASLVLASRRVRAKFP